MSLMGGSANRAREMIDFHLASEPPEFKAKVFEILNFSGLEPNDPMFLALLLTGQIRVFIEAAVEELPQLLSQWKQEMAKSLETLMSAMAEISSNQQKISEAIKDRMSAVSQKCVSDIKEAGMATTSAIADANNETLEQLQQTKKQVEDLSLKLAELDAKSDRREQSRIEDNEGVVKWACLTMKKQQTVNQQVDTLLSEVAKIQRNKVWLKIADGFYSFPILVACMLIAIGGTWWAASRKYNSSLNVLGRNLVTWNVDRIQNCLDTENPKCTLWIVSPDSPQRQE